MRRITLLFALLLAAITLPAQVVRGVDFEGIEKTISAKKSPYNYKKLLKAIEKGQEMSPEAMHYFYYGWVFQEEYSPYGLDDDLEKELEQAFMEGEYKEALKYADKMLDQNPTWLDAWLLKAVVCHQMGDLEAAELASSRFEGLVDVILASGDGNSVETAYFVTHVSDEYTLCRFLGYNVEGQALINTTDRLDLSMDPDDELLEEPREQIYFDVSRLFLHLRETLH